MKMRKEFNEYQNITKKKKEIIIDWLKEKVGQHKEEIEQFEKLKRVRASTMIPVRAEYSQYTPMWEFMDSYEQNRMY